MERSELAIKITALCENTSCQSDILSEHGLSLYIEACGHRILFDMGQTDMFADNAQTLGICLESVDIAVLSHGHYDHGGGLARFFGINQTAPVYLTKTAFEPHYNGTEKYIGLDTSVMTNCRIVMTESKTVISDGLTLLTIPDGKLKYPIRHGGLTKKTAAGYVADDFGHEQYLLIEEHGKRILISGCSHRGIENIMCAFSPDVLVGGFHFSKMPICDELAKTAKELESYKTAYYTCHCTGTAQFEFMKEYISDLNYLSAGQTVEI